MVSAGPKDTRRFLCPLSLSFAPHFHFMTIQTLYTQKSFMNPGSICYLRLWLVQIRMKLGDLKSESVFEEKAKVPTRSCMNQPYMNRGSITSGSGSKWGSLVV